MKASMQRGYDEFPRMTNPYLPGSESSALWAVGWNMAMLRNKRAVKTPELELETS